MTEEEESRILGVRIVLCLGSSHCKNIGILIVLPSSRERLSTNTENVNFVVSCILGDFHL